MITHIDKTAVDISELEKEVLKNMEGIKKDKEENYQKFLDSLNLKPHHTPDDRFSCPPL